MHDLARSVDGKQILSLQLLDGDFRDRWDELKDVDLDLELKKHREKRSKNANDYLWVLCEALAKNQGITKVEVYRKQIREVGVYAPLPVRETELERFSAAWSERGLGWFVDVIDDSFPGFKKVFAYYGTSVYNSEEMSRVINAAVEDCRALGIEVIPPEELSLLMEDWDAQHRSA